MSPFRRRSFSPTRRGRFKVNLAPEMRALLVILANEVDEIVTLDIPETRRLFPTAYPHDAEKDAGYQVFARDKLVERRKTAADTVRATADHDELSEDELAQWMAVVNDARLVIGTRLDVSEDDELDWTETDWNDPDVQLRIIYEDLGVLLDGMVKALMSALPESGEADD